MSPIYDFSGEVTTKFYDKTVLAGERFTTDRYFSDDDLNLVSHLPQVDPPPVNSMFHDDIVAGTISEVTVDQSYPLIVIYNLCGGILKVIANEDVDNYIPMANNTFWTLDNSKNNIGELGLSGEASGRVDVSGDMNIIGG